MMHAKLKKFKLSENSRRLYNKYMEMIYKNKRKSESNFKCFFSTLSLNLSSKLVINTLL
jgi:hypothetical protein